MSEAHGDIPLVDAGLRGPLERLLAERFDSPPRVTGIDRRDADYSSSYSTETITVHLAGREPLRIFLKNFAVAAWEKDLMPERRSRELTVYRDLLSLEQLGTPAYYGAVWDDARARYWLLLEHVDGPQVKWCEFDEWLRAAAWLGRLHGRFPPGGDDIANAGYLVQHDALYFRETMARAQDTVAAADPALGRRLAAATARYEDLIDDLVALPRTLVHGGYRPQNIIRGGADQHPRICPADWEEAAFGSQFYDFAYISDGFDGDRMDALWQAYRNEARRHGVEVPPDADAARLVSAFNVHKNLGTVSKAAARHFRPTAVEKLVTMIEVSAANAYV